MTERAEPSFVTQERIQQELQSAKQKALVGRTGGTYIPPARLAQMQKEVPKNSAEYQRISWEALKKSLNGLINKVNTSNIKNIVTELFMENLVRGKGLFVRSTLRAQAAALPFTPVYAALVSVINTKFPQIGELVLIKLILQFRRSYRRNDKSQCLPAALFIAHLINQRVAHEIIALQLLTLLLERPTDDSVEIAIGFIKECGVTLSDISPKPFNVIFERFRSILQEGMIDKRVQYMIEVLFKVRQDKFVGFPSIKEELDLVEEEDQITHYLSLDEEFEYEEKLVFQFDPDFEANEEKYSKIREEILGEENEESESESEEEEVEIKDETKTNLSNLRETIYLTVMSSLDFEECCHKLLKIKIPESQELELCTMLVECCSQERTFLKFYGLIAERLCNLEEKWQLHFESAFGSLYSTIHRFETNRIRNIAQLFAHLLNSNAIEWNVLETIKLTEDDTTSASRIFIKILLLALVEFHGLLKLQTKFDECQSVSGLFPKTNLRHTRFAINFFTAIGLGGLTDQMREFLANAPLPLEDDSSSETSDSSDSETDSESEDSVE